MGDGVGGRDEGRGVGGPVRGGGWRRMGNAAPWSSFITM